MVSGTVKTMVSENVPAGIWIVKGSVDFQSESGEGSRMAQIYKANDEGARQEVQGNSKGWTCLTVIDIIILTATTTISIRAKQTSGGTIQCRGYLGLVRIK